MIHRPRAGTRPAGLIAPARPPIASRAARGAIVHVLSGSASRGGSRAAKDAPSIEVCLECPRSGNELRIVRDGPGEPVYVAGLEGGDLTERVAVKLAELDRRRRCDRDGRHGRRPEPRVLCPIERSVRLRGTSRLAVQALCPEWRLARQAGRPAGRRIARPERLRRVQAPRDRPCRAGAWRPGRPALGRRVRAIPAGGPRGPHPKLLVGAVDLRHSPGRGTGRGRVAPRDVRMVLAGEPPPGRLDRGLGGASRDAEHIVGFAFRHPWSVPGDPLRLPADTAGWYRGPARRGG